MSNKHLTAAALVGAVTAAMAGQASAGTLSIPTVRIITPIQIGPRAALTPKLATPIINPSRLMFW